MFALVDGNNFFVSCERVRHPELAQKPVVVLSNNDGCIIARSNEVKALGIKMGEPVFKCREKLDRHRVVLLSSDVQWYRYLSRQVVAVFQQFSPDIEVYSIDESFIYFSTRIQSYHELGISIKKSVQDITGIPVGVGFGKTKTLAKIANKIAKKAADGVCCIHDYNEDLLLKTWPVQELWGIGRRFNTRLRQLNIHNSYQLKYAYPTLIKKRLHVWGARMQLELNGISCIPLETEQEPNKSIIRSRTFAKKLSDIMDITTEIATNIASAAEHLRQQHLKVKKMTIFLITNRFKDPHYYQYRHIELPYYTSATPELLEYAVAALQEMVQKNTLYSKSGVMMYELTAKTEIQTSLLFKKEIQKYVSVKQETLDKVMKSCDHINRRWGKGSIYVAVASGKMHRSICFSEKHVVNE